jgi:hypothetical protein
MRVLRKGGAIPWCFQEIACSADVVAECVAAASIYAESAEALVGARAEVTRAALARSPAVDAPFAAVLYPVETTEALA